MKKMISVILVIITVLVIFNSLFGNRINIPSILREFNINLALSVENDSVEDCPNLSPGFYNIKSTNSNNDFNGITISQDTTYFNVSSQYINSLSTCFGAFEFSATDFESVNYLSQENFNLEPGMYTVGENIAPGEYEITSEFEKNEVTAIHTTLETLPETFESSFVESNNGEPIYIELLDDMEIMVYVYKDNILGTDEIVDKNLRFKKIE